MDSLSLATFEYQAILKLVIAMVLGWIIGWERKHWKKPAGGRTFMLICMGSCLFTLVSMEAAILFAGTATVDPTRIASNILTGMGFIGGGIILHREDHVEGVTSAAAIWVAAAVGMAVAFEMYLLAALTSLFTVVGLNLQYVMRRFMASVTNHNNNHNGDVPHIQDEGQG